MEECQHLSNETIDETNLIKLLIDYKVLLNDRIEALEKIISKLNDKAEGTDEKYSIIRYKMDLNYLNKLEKQVCTIGKELQENAIIFLRENRI